MRIRKPRITYTKNGGLRLRGGISEGPAGLWGSVPLGRKTTKTGRKRRADWGAWFRL